MSLKDRIDGRVKLDEALQNVKKSISVIIKLHADYKEMTSTEKFEEIQEIVQPQNLDVRSEMNLAVLLYTTRKVLV